ncbi:hypothetical protein [Variovorax rhizosphaerae]|uniref:RIP homotypic interaction motif (RHIM)-containing protein n=1 Tax=Variovorax rhizosphaerae TaxID=1836200 RepID=A0ABU8WFS4_9BURK
MDLQRMMTDDAFVEDGAGQSSGPYKTKFGDPTLVFYDQDIVVNEGDFIIQKLPGDRTRRHRVVDVQHSSGLGSIPPHFTVKIGAAVTAAAAPASNTYNIHATNVQVGNHNAQHITASFQTLVSDIDKSSSSAAEKQEAKSRLLRVLESPAVVAVLGGAAGGLIKLLGQ